MRKRGKEAGTEESKKATEKRNQTKKPAEPNALSKMYSKYAPAMLQRRVTAKLAFDVTLFAGCVYIIYKYGQNMNDFIQETVPSEASMR